METVRYFPEFSILPDEVKLKVFSNFDCKELLTTIGLVSQEWLSLARDPQLWKWIATKIIPIRVERNIKEDTNFLDLCKQSALFKRNILQKKPHYTVLKWEGENDCIINLPILYENNQIIHIDIRGYSLKKIC